MIDFSPVTTLDISTAGLVEYSGPVTKAQPNPLSVSGISLPYTDYFNRQRSPSKQALNNQFKRHVYACASLNANTFATSKLRLYVKTNANQRAPRVPTKALNYEQEQYLKKEYGTFNFFKEFAKVEEVLKHPILDLFNSVNETNLYNEFTLLRDTQLYLEIVGVAYWYIEASVFGRPQAIWLLPSQFVEPKSEPGSNNYIDYYEYTPGNGSTPEKFMPWEIISFRFADLDNPYTNGKSPAKAAWEDVQIEAKLLGHLTNTLDNEGRPDAIITPKEPIGSSELEEFERKLNRRFAKGRSGGIFVSPEDAKFEPISWPLGDIARLEIQKSSKLAIANAFATPIALIESQSINRATLEAAQIQHGRYCIRPRHKNFIAVLNSRQFVNRWDESGRIFLAFDDPVPEDEEIKLKKHVGLVGAGIETSNEAREEYKLPPHKDGNELQSKQMMQQKWKDDKERQRLNPAKEN